MWAPLEMCCELSKTQVLGYTVIISIVIISILDWVLFFCYLKHVDTLYCHGIWFFWSREHILYPRELILCSRDLVPRQDVHRYKCCRVLDLWLHLDLECIPASPPRIDHAQCRYRASCPRAARDSYCTGLQGFVKYLFDIEDLVRCFHIPDWTLLRGVSRVVHTRGTRIGPAWNTESYAS